MITATPQRIVELWPTLTGPQREALIDLAEAAAAPQVPLSLSEDELAALARSKADFAAGRSRSLPEAERETDEFLRNLRSRS